MTVWFTSDPHFGHAFMANLRGFGMEENSTQRHDQTLMDNWDSVVRPADQVWVLGDLAMSNPTYALALLAGLNGEKHLVLGNHDSGHPMHRNAHRQQRQYFEAFASVQTMARRRVLGINVLLSHFPYTTYRGFEARYPQYRLPDLGEWLLHGHTHSANKWTGDHEIHVGLDAWDLLPVSLTEIEKMIAWSEGMKDGVVM